MTTVRCLLRCALFVLAFAPLSAYASTARVYVTNSAGDSIHVIDTATNKVVQVIKASRRRMALISQRTDQRSTLATSPLARLMCSIVRVASSSRKLS
jgi:YVTN family beta-propeller protein